MRATGPAKGEQPATAVPDSRKDGTPDSGPSPGRPVFPREGVQGGEVESGARSGSGTTETPEDGPSAGARLVSGLGNGPPARPARARRAVRCASHIAIGTDARSASRTTSGGERGPRGKQRTAPPVARRRKVYAAGGSTLAATCVTTSSLAGTWESARVPGGECSGGRGTPWTRPAEKRRGERGRSKPPGSWKRRRRNGSAGGTAVAPATPKAGPKGTALEEVGEWTPPIGLRRRGLQGNLRRGARGRRFDFVRRPVA